MPMGYMGSTIIPTMAFMPIMNMGLYGVGAGADAGTGASASSSMNASSSKSTVVDGTTESQRVPWGGEAPSRANKSSDHAKHLAPSKKGKEDDDFAVPTYSSATQGSSQTRPSINPPQVQQSFGGGRSVQKGKGLVTEKQSPAFSTQLRRISKEKSMEDDASWTSASDDCLTVSFIDNDLNTQEISNRKLDGVSRDCDGHQTELGRNAVGKKKSKGNKVDGGQIDEDLTKPSDTSAVVIPPEILLEDESLRVVPEQDIFSSQSTENRSREVSETSQRSRGGSAETESSILEDLPLGSSCFQELLDHFGQQELWKAQKAIIRQQKVFSRQVFELHRVIEVQRLLAKLPSLSFRLDEVIEAEGDNVPLLDSPVAEVPEVPEVPEVSGRSLEKDISRPSDEISSQVPESLSQPAYPLSTPPQQGFNPASPWQAATYSSNPYAARMSSPHMYVPYPGPCSPGYGVYPMMGAPMSMYGNFGGMQASRFPTWQQQGMSQPWGPSDPAAAGAVWYGQQMVPAVGPATNMGVIPMVTNCERQTSSGAAQLIQRNYAQKGSARQAGEKSDVGGNRSKLVNAVESCGWAKGWGSTEDRRGHREPDASRNKEFGAVPLGDESERQDGETRRVETGGGVGQPNDEGVRMVEREKNSGVLSAHGREVSTRGGELCDHGEELGGLELERNLPAGARHEEPLEVRTLKRPRTEFPKSDGFPWFPIISPAKRVMQQCGVIKVVPRAVSATQESAASILLSIQKERQR